MVLANSLAVLAAGGGEDTAQAGAFAIPLWFEIGSLVVLSLILIADLLLIIKRPHVPSAKESTLWVVFYVTLALIFAAVLGFIAGWDWAGLFVAGWATEYSLSIDNLFVFVLIMTQFRVPRRLQQEVLMVGIIIALVLRAGFIFLGVTLINAFSPVFYLFGAFLLWTAYKQAFDNGHDDEEAKESKIITFLRRRVEITDEFDGSKLRTVVNGKKMFTPMLVVFVAIGLTDLMFAIDSIPAILGITHEFFIVLTANIFALMGLRQLYFLLGGMLEKLRYLHIGIAVILAFIGVKLILHALHVNDLPFLNNGEGFNVPEVETWMSLTVIFGSLIIATIASLVASRRDERRAPKTSVTPVVGASAVSEGEAQLNESSVAPTTIDGTKTDDEDYLKP